MISGRLRRNATGLVIAVPLVFLWLAVPAMRAVDRGEEAKQRRIRIDLYSGLSWLDPRALNQIVDYDTGVRKLAYDDYLDYLKAGGAILAWSKEGEGRERKIKFGVPFGIRVRYSVSDFLAVSVGLEAMRGGRDGSSLIRYVRYISASDINTESLDISAYRLKTRAYAPSVGIHLFKRFGSLDAEVFFAGGPLFAACSYESRVNYTWMMQSPVATGVPFSSESLLAQDGSGTGVSLEAGGRLSLPVFRRVDLFLEGGCAYQVVKSLSGEGSEIQGGTLATWKGTWREKTETLTTPWGLRTWRFPTNYETEASGTGDFRLDLSGFRLRIGVSVGF